MATTAVETTSFAAGKGLSSDLRASTPEAMAGLMQELERISKTKADYVIGSPKGGLALVGDDLRFSADLSQPDDPGWANVLFQVRPIAHEQLGEKTGIPRAYYKRMLEDDPELLVRNVNNWLTDEPKNVLLRTVDGALRAVLSDRYRVMDSYDVAGIVMDVLSEEREKTGRNVGMVQRLDLSEEKFFMRVMHPDFGAKISGRAQDLKEKGTLFAPGYRRDDGTWQGFDDDDPEGDWVFGGVVVRNSEVGRGGLTVDAPVLFRPGCWNLIMVSTSLRKVHLGGRLEEGIRLSEETVTLKDKALGSEIRDMVRATFDPELFREAITRARGAAEVVLENPVEAVDNVVKVYGLSDDRRTAIFNELVSPSFPNAANPGITPWGLVNAITAQAHKTEDVEEGFELETVGGDFLANWKERELVAVRPR